MTRNVGEQHANDAARAEALRRFGVEEPPSNGSDPFLDEVVGFARLALGADEVSLALVTPERVRTLASTSPDAVAEMPRTTSFVDHVLVAAGGVLVVREPDGLPSDREPVVASATPPGTLAACVVVGPDGEPIGVLEAVWAAAGEPDETVAVQLRQAGAIVSRVLEVQAEVSEYARFVELTPNPVAILDGDGVIEEVNPAFAELVGRLAASLQGQGFLDLVARTDRTRVTAQLARVLFRQRGAARITCALLTAGGREVPCSVTAGHLGGPHRHLQLIVHDLSEQQRAQAEQSRLSEQLARAQRLDAVGQIAGGLSHDLNNLLVVMTSNLGLAMESLDEVTVQDATIDVVRDDLRELEIAIERAGAMTSKLLAFARGEEGAERRAHLPEVLDAVEVLLGRSLRREITLTIRCPDDVPLLAVDPVQLERVLVNLVINSRDALEGQSGTITITVDLMATAEGSAPPDGPDGGPVTSGGQQVRITVRDDGPGMDEATRAQAFEPLFSTKQELGGSGLGLATVLAFVEQSDGDVQLRSSPGGGTTVTLWLPVIERVAPPVPVGVDVPVAGARVVVVDPGDRTRRVIAAMLTGAGYRVTAVSSAEAALDVVETGRPDLLITELALSGMPGTRLIRAAMERHPGLRCIAIASVDQPHALDPAPVLVKPFSHDRLLRTVREVLGSG